LQPTTFQGLVDWKCNVQDLELLHFYTTVTSLSFSNIPERQGIWQFVVPQLAFSFDFMLHGILTFAAIHLSNVQPERKTQLRDTSTMHYGIASASFRRAVSNLTRENSEACFAFASFVAIYS
jgi:hypothetical protein